MIENNLVKYLLDFDSSTSSSSDTSSLSTNEIIKSLNDLTNIIHKLPKNILAKSKLLRVLILSIRKPNDELKNIKPTMQKYYMDYRLTLEKILKKKSKRVIMSIQVIITIQKVLFPKHQKLNNKLKIVW